MPQRGCSKCLVNILSYLSYQSEKCFEIKKKKKKQNMLPLCIFCFVLFLYSQCVTWHLAEMMLGERSFTWAAAIWQDKKLRRRSTVQCIAEVLNYGQLYCTVDSLGGRVWRVLWTQSDEQTRVLLTTLHWTDPGSGRWNRIRWKEYQFWHRIHLNWIIDRVPDLSLSGLWCKINRIWNQRWNGVRFVEHCT